MTYFLYYCVSLAYCIYFFIYVSYYITVNDTSVSLLKRDQNERVFIIVTHYFYLPRYGGDCGIYLVFQEKSVSF